MANLVHVMQNLNYHEILPKRVDRAGGTANYMALRFIAHFVQGQTAIYKSFWVYEVENQLITGYE